MYAITIPCLNIQLRTFLCSNGMFGSPNYWTEKSTRVRFSVTIPTIPIAVERSEPSKQHTRHLAAKHTNRYTDKQTNSEKETSACDLECVRPSKQMQSVKSYERHSPPKTVGLKFLRSTFRDLFSIYSRSICNYSI